MICPGCRKDREPYRRGLCIFCHDGSYPENKNLPQQIDWEFINQLKIRGKRSEAKELLLAMQNSLHKEKKTELKYYNKRLVEIRKVQGYCTSIWCKNQVEEGYLRCVRCRNYQKEYSRKKRISKK